MNEGTKTAEVTSGMAGSMATRPAIARDRADLANVEPVAAKSSHDGGHSLTES